MNAEEFQTIAVGDIIRVFPNPGENHASDRGKPRKVPMNEGISRQIAALNVAWQRYARAIEQQLDTIPMDALNRDFVAAWAALAACGIVESMLAYGPATMTFSLPMASGATMIPA